MSRVLTVAMRLPVTVTVQGGRPVIEPSVGGVATGLRAVHREGGEGAAAAGEEDDLWIGWPGMVEGLDAEGQRILEERLAALRAAPVRLTAREMGVFYEGVANGVLWPVCHDRLDQLPLHVSGWDVYERINARFADAAARYYHPGDLIWVHDYQLLRVPALLRERLPHARIGFFLHIPFPNPEIFFALSCREWLIEGMLGADVIGFHTRRYRGHFAAALRRLFRLEMEEGTIPYQGRRVRLGIFPMGVDAAGLAARAAEPAVLEEARELRGVGDARLLVGVDRLDYTKGIPRRLLAFERLLERHPEWRGHVYLVQIAVPSRTGVGAYRRFREQVDAQVGRINGAFGTPHWTPIRYVHRSVSQETLLALYRAADVMLVTPVRDGMNLVSKEFVASRTDEDGVLLLSEFAGAADELSEALIVNPYDADGVAEAMHRALTMPAVERRERMHALHARVMANDVVHWAGAFLSALAGEGGSGLGDRGGHP
jgi:trehalose 6-phosphate synthase/phosphatase